MHGIGIALLPEQVISGPLTGYRDHRPFIGQRLRRRSRNPRHRGDGSQKLIFAGISLEVCAAFPAITAIGKGPDAYVAVDASGTFSETKREAGLLRLLQAGVIVSDYTTLVVEILKDNAQPEAGEVFGAMDMDRAKLVGRSSTPTEVTTGEKGIRHG